MTLQHSRKPQPKRSANSSLQNKCGRTGKRTWASHDRHREAITEVRDSGKCPEQCRPYIRTLWGRLFPALTGNTRHPAFEAPEETERIVLKKLQGVLEAWTWKRKRLNTCDIILFELELAVAGEWQGSLP